MAKNYLVVVSQPQPGTAWQALDFFTIGNDPGARLLARIGNAGPWVPVKQSGLVVGVDAVLASQNGPQPWAAELWTGGP